MNVNRKIELAGFDQFPHPQHACHREPSPPTQTSTSRSTRGIRVHVHLLRHFVEVKRREVPAYFF